jgi:hypothetical protein
MFALVFTIDGRTERHLLATGDTTVGRASTCDLVIADPSISRRHARFRVHGEHCLLTDLGGRNGTFLNGEAVAEAHAQPGDTVTLGRFALALQRASDVAPSLSEHEPQPDGPATMCRRIDDPDASGSWRLAADSARLFHLLSAIARRVVHWHSPRDLMSQIVDVAFDTIAADRVFLLSCDAGGPPVSCVGRTRAGREADSTTISRATIERVIRERIAMLSVDALPLSQTPSASANAELPRRSFVAAPIWNQRDVIGVLFADAPAEAPLDAADMDVLHALALYAGAAIEQARDTDRLLLDARRGGGDSPGDSGGGDAAAQPASGAVGQNT